MVSACACSTRGSTSREPAIPRESGGPMKMRRCLLAVLVTLAVLAGSAVASAQTPKRGGVIRIAEREAPSLDPHLSISFLTHSYVSLSYSQMRVEAGRLPLGDAD